MNSEFLPFETAYLFTTLDIDTSNMTSQKLEEAIVNKLASDWGFSADGFDYSVLYADGKPVAVAVTDIVWDFDSEEDSIWDDKFDDDPCFTVYTHDEAADIVGMFEELLLENKLKIPSPEDDERDPDDQFGMYGSTYDELLSGVESALVEIIARIKGGASVIEDEFS